MCCTCCSATQRKLWFFGCATFILLFGVVIGILWPTLARNILHSELVLKEGSMNYENWVETPIPMYLEVTLFNWDNPDDFEKPNYKPSFSEVGPFVFREKHKRVNIVWNSNNTVSFNQIRSWEFDEDLSNGTLSQPVTAANVITATVANKMRNANSLMKKVVNYLLNKKGGSLTWTKPAGDWIFNGFDDELLTFLRGFNSTAFNIPFSKFGWLVDRNNSETYDGHFTMKTGQDDIHQLGYLTKWNDATTTNFNSGDCGKVNGSTGELWAPEMDIDESVTVFATDICRYVKLSPKSGIDKFGIAGRMWGTDARTFDDGSRYPEMKCFCPENSACPRYGVADVSKCRFGAPVYVSFPHFYLAHPSYLEAVDGLKPVQSKHDFSLSLEPTTGIPLDVNARLQINMLLPKISGIDIYEKTTEVVMPMFWFSQRAELNEEFAEKAKLALSLPSIGKYVAFSVGGIGVFLILVGIIWTATREWKRRSCDDEQPLSNE